MVERARTDPGLTDRSGFWLAMAGVLVTLGAAATAIATAEYHKPWTSGWFVAGVMTCAPGCLSASWALIFYLANRLAGDRWCPNPQVHVRVERSDSAATEPVIQAELVGWLIPVLRHINGDLRRAAAGVEDALNSGSYLDLGPLDEFRLRTWEATQDKLAGLEGRGDLFDDLQEADRRVARLRRILLGTPRTPGPTKPRAGDDLGSTLGAICKAEAAVARELLELENRAPHARGRGCA